MLLAGFTIQASSIYVVLEPQKRPKSHTSCLTYALYTPLRPLHALLRSFIKYEIFIMLNTRPLHTLTPFTCRFKVLYKIQAFIMLNTPPLHTLTPFLYAFMVFYKI